MFITDIYSAGEMKQYELNNDSLVNSLIAAGHKDVRSFDELELKKLILKDLNFGDIVVFMGAGDISSKAKLFVNEKLIEY